jgi:DNA-binding IclR family transcriptional regulator
MEHPRAAEIDGTARAVLAAMAWPAKDQDPRCFASHASIARRSGFDRRTVRRAQERLAELGVIERVPTGRGMPAEWRLVLLVDAAEGGSESPTSTPPDVGQKVPPPGSESPTP